MEGYISWALVLVDYKKALKGWLGWEKVTCTYSDPDTFLYMFVAYDYWNILAFEVDKLLHATLSIGSSIYSCFEYLWVPRLW